MEMELKDRMIRYRAKHRINQGELAERCGVTKQTVCNIENGYQQASKITRLKIEMVLNEGEPDETKHYENQGL